ncbi:MAG: hypothetical protein GX318_07395 [Clostridia bacterium]|nr:hypothetical protein [Clostridia bacterium]
MKNRSLPLRLVKFYLDPRVSKQKKYLLPILVLFYWVMPDLLPFNPLDDIIFTLLMAWLFTRPGKGDDQRGAEKEPRPWEKDDTITVDAELMGDEEEE